jgi:streptogramin lyase
MKPILPPPTKSRIISAASLLSFSLLFAICGLQAQDEPVISRILERGPHHRVVEFTRTLTDTNGVPYTHVGQYTEIANGLHYLVNGEWVESEEIIVPHPLGAAAQRGLYRVLFPANLNRRGAIEIEMPDGRTLRNHPLGIYITDASVGKSVLVGQLKDSIGVLLPPNEVLYSDAFEGIQADMIYRYRKGGFEASVILREQPLLPRDFDPESTLIELATEFLEPPERIIDRPPPTSEVESQEDPTLSAVESVDHMVDFGDMQLVQGHAFSVESADSGGLSGGAGVPVEKSWLVIEGRQVLLESVRLPGIAPFLGPLPIQRNSWLQQAAGDSRRILPAVSPVPQEAEPMLLAADRTGPPGLVIDYILAVSSSSVNFYSGPTWVVNNWITVSYTTQIQPGAIIKFAPGSGITVSGYLLTPTEWSSRAILTCKDDDSVGEPVGSGNPPDMQDHTALKLYYAQPVADLQYKYPGKIQRLEILYAGKGIHDYSPGANHQVYNNRFRRCDVGVVADNTTVTIDDVIMCDGMVYNPGDFYELRGSGAVVVGPDDISTDCGGWAEPTINVQPIGGAVSAGGGKTFTVSASGKCLLYQWYHNGVSITGASPAANYWSYPIYPVQLAHAGEYYVEVRNDKAFVRSDRVTLTVTSSPPQIYQQPFSQKIRTGATVRFAVGAAGQAPLTYQWYRGATLLTGATAYDLVLTSVNSGHAGNYTVRVSNSYGNVVSQVAALTVLSAGTSVIYTSNQDFAKGILINLNCTTVANELQINANPTPLPFVNVPCSGRGTLARIDANTGKVLGEYATAASGSNPSRTAVDRNGNVWLANRNAASVTKFGVIIGGIRGNKSGSTFLPNPDGQYVGPPFVYNTCRDRHGTTIGSVPDGLIKTSRRLTDILLWNEDEAMIFNVPWTDTQVRQPRTLAVDKDDNVWVGGGVNYSLADQPHQKFNGFTGAAISGASFNQQNYGGYGGFVDGTGYLWSAGGGGGATPGLLRANVNSMPYSFNPLGNSHGNYGIAIDPRTQRVWYGFRKVPPQTGQLGVYNSNGALFTDYYYPSPYPRGMVIDSGYNVWVANSSGDALALGKEVTHLRTDGTVVGNVDLMFVPPAGDLERSGHEPTGLAVDTNGKVWVANRTSDNVMRIDPNAGPQGRNLYSIGAVDLTVDLGDGFQHPAGWQNVAGPYSYSDMTGFVTLGSTFSSGSWTFVHDEGVSRTWNLLSWTGYTPTYTWINVDVRAGNSVTDLPNLPFQSVVSGQPIVGVSGRYLDVRVTLHRQALNAATPRLEALTVHAP